MVRSAKDWPWSSYRATAGFIKPEKRLKVNWILSSFSRKKSEAVKLYRAFVSEGRNQPGPWEVLKNQIYLGDEEFVDEIQDKISAETNLSEVPSSQKRPVAKSLEYYEKEYSDRDTSIFKAYESGAYSMKAIGDYFGLHYSWVSRIIKARDKTPLPDPLPVWTKLPGAILSVSPEGVNHMDVVNNQRTNKGASMFMKCLG